jgi:uncharacterized repeat protein (TIGR01451 family)
MTIARHVKNASLALIALSSFGILQGAYANGTLSGTVINNTATVDYSVGSVAQTQLSASASFTVDTKINFTLINVEGAAVTDTPGHTNVMTTFRLTNTGNFDQGFVLTPPVNEATNDNLYGQNDTADVANLRVFVDNGDGVYGAGDTATNVNSLAAGPAGVSVLLFVFVDIPVGLVNNDYANVRLTAQATPVGSTTPIAQTNTADTTGVDVVWADAGRDNSESARSQYQVASAALTVTKASQVISDDFNGTSNPKAIPNAVVRYTITVTNNSTTTAANAVTVTDNIPANTTFVPGSITLNTGSVADGTAFQSGPPARVVVNAGAVAQNGGTATVTFQVRINN